MSNCLSPGDAAAGEHQVRYVSSGGLLGFAGKRDGTLLPPANGLGTAV